VPEELALRRLVREGWRRLLVEKVPYLVLSLIGSAVAIIAVRNGATFTEYGQYGPSARVAMTGYGIIFYPWKWLWPTGLSPLYELPVRIEPLSWRFLLPWIVIALVTGLLVGVRRRWPAGLAAWIYSAIMVLPVIGPLHSGNQLAHDRYSYLSGLGFAVVAGAGLAWVLRAAARDTGADYAIKLLRPGMASDEILRRFSRERRILARLAHATEQRARRDDRLLRVLRVAIERYDMRHLAHMLLADRPAAEDTGPMGGPLAVPAVHGRLL
jgi:hypothetical protein